MKGGFQNYAPPPFHSPTPLDDWGGGVGMEGHTICRHEKSPITATNFRRVERGGDITTSSYFFHASAADTPPRERNGRLKNTRPLHTPPKGKFLFPPPPIFPPPPPTQSDGSANCQNFVVGSTTIIPPPLSPSNSSSPQGCHTITINDHDTTTWRRHRSRLFIPLHPCTPRYFCSVIIDPFPPPTNHFPKY